MKFIKNIFLAILLSVFLLFVLEQSIRRYTNHGTRVKIPNVKKLNYLEAIKTLENVGLEPIIQDSVYTGDFKKMSITEQDPDPGQEVKEGRKIYLTINSLAKPKVRMPKLKDNSINLAKALLTNAGLMLGNIVEKPSLLGTGVVLKQFFKGDTIVSGKLIEKGAKIDLWVSKYIDIDSVYINGVDSMQIEGWQYKDGIMNDKLKNKIEKNKKDTFSANTDN